MLLLVNIYTYIDTVDCGHWTVWRDYTTTEYSLKDTEAVPKHISFTHLLALYPCAATGNIIDLYNITNFVFVYLYRLCCDCHVRH